MQQYPKQSPKTDAQPNEGLGTDLNSSEKQWCRILTHLGSRQEKWSLSGIDFPFTALISDDFANDKLQMVRQVPVPNP